MKDKSRSKTINKSSNGKKHHAIRASADSFLAKILALIVAAGFIALLAPAWRDTYDYISRQQGIRWDAQPTPTPRIIYVNTGVRRCERHIQTQIIINKPPRKRVLGIF